MGTLVILGVSCGITSYMIYLGTISMLNIKAAIVTQSEYSACVGFNLNH
jgi:hypothetical protein